MAKPASGKRTSQSGRTTPKGTTSKAPPSNPGRYTPPIPKSTKVSPRWVPALMFFFLLAGAAVILLNYLSLLPGDADNRYLLVGLALITGGFVTATRFH
jgi:hypothetical protein